MPLQLGTRLGPFEILAPLGAGGMGEVYRARDTRLGREVAVKVLSPEFSGDADRRKRFEQEASSASALNHPNIVTIHEIGSTDGTIYIAMEVVDGKTLREVLHGDALSTKKLLDLAYQISDGLAKAHAAGIVHRDLKPENVMVSRDGAVKILDFGLAKLLKTQPEEGSNLPTSVSETRAGTVMGTVGYMSPEQASGKPADFRSDQFSLGSIFYEMATGKRAFQRGTSAETLTAIIREEAEPVGQVNANVPGPFRWIIDRCLQKDPDERYASTRDLSRDVRSVREHLSEVTVTGETSGVATGARPRRKVSFLRALLTAAAIVAAFAAGMLLQRRLGSVTPPSYQQITFGSGTVQSARFAPDGQTIVYSAGWDGKARRLFLKHPSVSRRCPCELPSANRWRFPLQARWRSPSTAATPIRGLSGNARPRGVDRRRVPRRRGECPGGELVADGVNMLVVRDVAGKARLEYPMARSCTRRPVSSATRACRRKETKSPLRITSFPRTTRGPWRCSASTARRRR